VKDPAVTTTDFEIDQTIHDQHRTFGMYDGEKVEIISLSRSTSFLPLNAL